MRISRSIIYFGYLGDEATDGDMIRRRLAFMGEQLRWLSELIDGSGDHIRVLVPYVAPYAWDADVHHVISRHGFHIDPASAAADRCNRFEYPGFRAMKLLAETMASGDLIYYCHSKGVLQLSPSKMGLFRLDTQVGLTADLTELTERPDLTRAGMFPSQCGWCWQNFFWIKAGYMAGLTVEESVNRYHFEALIGDKRDKEGYRRVLPLIDRVPIEDTGIAVKPWYLPEETTSPALLATCYRYAAMRSPVDLANSGKVRLN